MERGAVGDMVELGITESFQCKRQVLLSAAEAAEMILRVDDIIKAPCEEEVESIIYDVTKKSKLCREVKRRLASI